MVHGSVVHGPEHVHRDGSGPTLALEHISKRYGATRALVDVSLTLRSGEVHALVGENGAGKSTLMKVLAGAVAPDAGRIVIAGTTRVRLTPRDAMSLGVSIVYQDADLVGSLTVAQNVFLGQEPVGRLGLVDGATQSRIARRVIDELGVDLDPDTLASRLSPAQRQLTQIVRALRTEPRVLVMDEPTTSLGRSEVRHLMDVIRRLAGTGIGIIYISHLLDEVLEIADRVTVLKDGHTVASRPAAGCTAADLATLMVGRTAAAFFTRDRIPVGDVVLRASGITGPGIPEPVSFEVRQGEVLGFGGLVGAGRTELMELLFGSARARSGQMSVDGRVVRIDSPHQAVAAGLGMVTEDRAGSGLFRGRSIRENLATAWTELRGPVVRGEHELASRLVDTLGIVTAGVDQEVSSLSGGNQQKVVIGRWLAIDASVLIFDEPTKGVDIGAKQEIYRLIGDLLRDGKAVLLVSSELPELLSLSDRIAIMRGGRLVGIVDAYGATEQDLMRAFLGVTDD